MRINSLELVNFRSYEHAVFRLADRTYFVGHNESGKSTAIEAIGWALTGHLRGLDGTNRDIMEIIREGAVAALRQMGKSQAMKSKIKGMGVKLELDAFGSIVRQTNGQDILFNVKDWTGSTKEQQARALEELRTTRAVVAACVDTPAFLELHHSDAKALIMSLLDARIAAEDLAPLDIVGPLSNEERERLYKRAFDDRTVAKRELEAHFHYPKPEGDEPPTVEDLMDDLETLRAQERGLIGSNAEARGQREALVGQREALVADQRTLERRIKGYGDPHQELDALENTLRDLVIPPDPALDPEAAPAVVEQDDSESVQLRAALVDERGRLHLISGAVDGIDRHDPSKGCVLDGAIPCLTPAKEFRGKLASIRKDIKTLEKSILERDTRLSTLEAEAATRRIAAQQAGREARANREERQGAYRRAVASQSQMRKDAAAAQAKIDHLEQDRVQLADVLEKIARLDTSISNLGEIKEPVGLAVLQSRIKRGDGLVAEARSWHEANARYLDSAPMRAHLEEKVAKLERRCEQLGPTGLIVGALDRARGAFEDKVNVALARWGYHLAFTIDPWTIRVNGRKFTQLSKSQRLRVGLCLQLAIAEISGLWFIAVDELDMLTTQNRTIVSDVIDGWPGQIVFGVTKDDDYELPDEVPDGVAIYQLELREGLTHVRQPQPAHA